MTRTHDPKFDARYNDGWHNLSKAVKQSQMQGDRVQCACCQRLFAWEDTETHHTSYLGDGDRAGVNLFALCGDTKTPGTCHHWVHLKEQWYRSQEDPVWGSGNFDDVVVRLQQNYANRSSSNQDHEDFPWAGIIAVTIAALLGYGLFAHKQPVKQPTKTIVISHRANVRSAPNGKILCQVEPNEVLKTIGSEGLWEKVKACGSQGFVHRSLVSK